MSAASSCQWMVGPPRHFDLLYAFLKGDNFCNKHGGISGYRMHKEPKTLTFDDFADELMAERQPRALVILASAKIDAQLRSILEIFLYPKAGNEKDPDELFDGDTPLSSFSSKIKMTRRLGLIDADLYHTLDLLRKIRNQAAHWVSFGVATTPLRDQLNHLQKLVASRRSYKLTVERFFAGSKPNDKQTLQAVLLTLCVLLGGIHESTHKTALSKIHKPIKLN